MGKPTKKERETHYLIVNGFFHYNPEAFTLKKKYHQAKAFVNEYLARREMRMSIYEDRKALIQKHHIKYLATNGARYIVIIEIKEGKQINFKEKPEELFDTNAVIEFHKGLQKFEMFVEDTRIEKEDDPFHGDYFSCTNYQKDKKTGRIRIPTHERKNIFRIRHPLGLIRERLLENDREEKFATAEGRIYRSKNDFISETTVNEKIETIHIKLDSPIAIGQAYEEYETLDKAMSLSGIKNGGQHYPEAAITAAVGRGLTNAGIPAHLDSCVMEELKVLDRTNIYVRKEMLKFDKKGRRTSWDL